MMQWDEEANQTINAEELLPGSHIIVGWKCEYGHKWKTDIDSRVRGAGCPYCNHTKPVEGENDFATLYPELMKQWDTEANSGLIAEQLLPGSSQIVGWRCENGHRWNATISARTHGTGCPYCSGKRAVEGENDFATLYPELMKQWDAEANRGIIAEQLLPGSGKVVGWKCENGHKWKAAICARVRGTGCPRCVGRKTKYKTPR